MKARVKEMEEEAEKLKEIQGEVEKQMMSSAKSRMLCLFIINNILMVYLCSPFCSNWLPNCRRKA